LYIPGARKVDRTEVLEQFITELQAMGHNVEQLHPGTPELEETFQTQVFLDSAEVLYKVSYAPVVLHGPFSVEMFCTLL
jgi:hypothetical protein